MPGITFHFCQSIKTLFLSGKSRKLLIYHALIIFLSKISSKAKICIQESLVWFIIFKLYNWFSQITCFRVNCSLSPWYLFCLPNNLHEILCAYSVIDSLYSLEKWVKYSTNVATRSCKWKSKFHSRQQIIKFSIIFEFPNWLYWGSYKTFLYVSFICCQNFPRNFSVNSEKLVAIL